MSNYGTNIGKGSSFGDSTVINNNTTIDKRKKVTLSVTIGTVVIVAVFIFGFYINNKTNICGVWTTSSGDVLEFLSDGTILETGHSNMHPDTYVITDEGYLKLGHYDASWIEYHYTYWDIEINGNTMKLISRDNPNSIIELKKE